MLPYSRRQIAVLLLVVAAAGAGLAVDHWRRGHPELAERLERFDHAPPAPLVTPGSPTATPTAPVAAPDEARHDTRRAPGALVALLDLNGATLEDLRRLPGVGPVLAARIVESRESDGRFATVDDLRRVRGLGPQKLARLRDLVTVAE